jgi:SAM-dependent methyltransferase
MNSRSLPLRPDSDPEFKFIEPPFSFNHPEVAKYPPEVSGARLLNSLTRRLGWTSLSGKRLMDYGCGVRLTRTIVNLGIDIGLYTGIDVSKEAIAWLTENVRDPRFQFASVDFQNDLYNKKGAAERDPDALRRMGFANFDAVCMFSVITHQSPDEVAFILALLRPVLAAGGALYFTTLINDQVDTYQELDPSKRRILSAYSLQFMADLVERGGWTIKNIFPPSPFQQTAFVCYPAG